MRVPARIRVPRGRAVTVSRVENIRRQEKSRVAGTTVSEASSMRRISCYCWQCLSADTKISNRSGNHARRNAESLVNASSDWAIDRRAAGRPISFSRTLRLEWLWNNYTKGSVIHDMKMCRDKWNVINFFVRRDGQPRAFCDVVAREDARPFFLFFFAKTFRLCSAIRDPDSREIISVSVILREHFHAWVLANPVIPSPWLHSWEPAGRAFVSRDSVNCRSASFLEVSTPSISVTVRSVPN